jgi:hypothetical protein
MNQPEFPFVASLQKQPPRKGAMTVMTVMLGAVVATTFFGVSMFFKNNNNERGIK